MKIRYDEKGKFYSEVITKWPIAVTLQTLTHRVHGNIYVLPDERPKDALNTDEHFIALTEATVYDAQGNEIYTAEFMAINRNHVIWVIPDPNQPETTEREDDHDAA